MKPTLRNLFGDKESHCKVGATYLWNAEGPSNWMPEGDWVYKRTKKTGWTRIECVYRRSGVNFLHIFGDNTTYEFPVWNGSNITDQLIPEVLDIKVFKQNPELDFVWNTYNGLVTIVNGYEKN